MMRKVLSLVLLVLLILLTACEIRPLDPATGKAIIEEAQQQFDAATFVDENWETQMLPYIDENAVDLQTLLAELQADEQAASTTYGHREGNRPYNFLVSGTGRVVSVDTTSRAGRLNVALPDGSPAEEVLLQIGPVIRATALRDAMPFITFDQFVNQLEYANVSNALHTTLYTSMLEGIDYNALLGKNVRFAGAFTLRDIDAIMITPVQIVEEAE